jgi:hypothetical protein
MYKFITLLFLIVSFSSNSQERATLKRLQHDKKVCKEFAETSIQEISNGVLLVRLNFRQKQINHLNKLNDTIAANQIKKRVLITNKKVTEAFSEKFNFCKVYFFKMSDSKHLKNQQFDSITFYDNTLSEVNSQLIKSNNYLIGEFNKIKQDTSHYYNDDIIDLSVDKSKKKVYYGGSKNGREAFIIMDRKFQQIQRPFPYFASLPSILSESARYKKAIESINLKLRNYTIQVGTKEE